MTGDPEAPPRAKGGLARLGAYMRAHWKELLAITLAAIPVAFILFHKGTQKAAQQAISYPAALFGGGGGEDGTTTSPPAANNNTGPAKSLPCPPGYHWVPPGGPKPGSGMKIASFAGHCEPDQVTFDKAFSVGGLHPVARSPKIAAKKTVASHVPAQTVVKKAPPHAGPTYRQPSSIDVKRSGPKFI